MNTESHGRIRAELVTNTYPFVRLGKYFVLTEHLWNLGKKIADTPRFSESTLLAFPIQHVLQRKREYHENHKRALGNIVEAFAERPCNDAFERLSLPAVMNVKAWVLEYNQQVYRAGCLDVVAVPTMEDDANMHQKAQEIFIVCLPPAQGIKIGCYEGISGREFASFLWFTCLNGKYEGGWPDNDVPMPALYLLQSLKHPKNPIFQERDDWIRGADESRQQMLKEVKEASKRMSSYTKEKLRQLGEDAHKAIEHGKIMQERTSTVINSHRASFRELQEFFEEKDKVSAWKSL
ncbi:hypothetical protein HYZ97_04805 [Candidatus Pacearchaeota archaeon]|nr:hypothetical protein [Candidatus Pacearchaeota archaeon]